jgi:hypothetical protein
MAATGKYYEGVGRRKTSTAIGIVAAMFVVYKLIMSGLGAL